VRVESDRMRTNVKNAELTAPELAQLGEFLSQVKSPRALSLEGMDGLFCALVAGPEWVTAGEYLPLLWGVPLRDDIVMFNLTQVNAMVLLLMRHWNSIQAQLERGAVHAPLIVHGLADALPGRTWAQGFMRGVDFTQAGWNELFEDEASDEFHRIVQLADGNDRQVRPDLLPQAIAQEFLSGVGPAVARAYRHFLDRRCTDRLTVELEADLARRWHNPPDVLN
jgi:uncharacterized protein